MMQEPHPPTPTDAPATGIDGTDNSNDIAKLEDDDGIGDVSTTFSPIWDEIAREQPSSSTDAAAAATNADTGFISGSNGVDNHDHINTISNEEDDLSVTFSSVWEAIAIEPTNATSEAVVQESSSSRNVLRERPEFPSSRSSSSHSNSDMPIRYIQHDNPHQSRIRMMEDSRSLDSMTVMYHSRNPHRNHNQNSNNENNRNDTDENDASDVGVVPTVVTYEGRNHDDDEQDLEQTPSRATRLRNYRRICYWSLRLMFFPIWLLVSVFTVSTVIAFCILPGILIISIMISCYYCCSRDPIPFNVLMQALLLDDENINTENTNAPTRTKDEIRDLLICRTCTKIQARRISNCAKDNTVTTTDTTYPTNNQIPNIHQPDHEEIVSHGPIYVATENYSLTFSEWIVSPTWPEVEEEINVGLQQYLHLNSIENVRTSSVDAVQALSTDNHDVDEDDIEVHADDHHTSHDVEQGRNSVIEMTAIPSTGGPSGDPIEGISFTELANKVKSTQDQIPPLALDGGSSPDDDDDYFESGIGCDICLRRYQEKDIVAWSHNAQCIHAYHLHCITDWLQKKITCPNCRCHYIPKHTNNHEHKRNVQRTQSPHERIVMHDGNNIVSVPAATATITTTTGVAQNSNVSRSSTAARTSAILQHQRSITSLHP